MVKQALSSCKTMSSAIKSHKILTLNKLHKVNKNTPEPKEQ